MLDASIEPVLFSSTNFAEPSARKTFRLLQLFLLEELVKLALAPREPLLELVEHRYVQLVAPVDKNRREEEDLDVHEVALERCFFFLIVQVGRLLRLLVHLFISPLLL